jgi:hypothetical protein
MNNNLLKITFKQRLNKLSSMDYDSIEDWEIAEIFNKAQTEWVRRQLHGSNIFKEGDEQSKRRIDDLQILLTALPLEGKNRPLFYEGVIPDNYLEFKRVSADALTKECPEARRLSIFLGEETNVDQYLRDQEKCPSLEWAETFCTMISGKLRIWSDKKFSVVNPVLTYYRQPRPILFLGMQDIATGQIVQQDQESELKDDVINLIIDEAISIQAGDIESFNHLGRTQQNAERNN